MASSLISQAKKSTCGKSMLNVAARLVKERGDERGEWVGGLPRRPTGAGRVSLVQLNLFFNMCPILTAVTIFWPLRIF